MKIYLDETEWKQLIKAALLDSLLRHETANGDIPLDGMHYHYGEKTVEVTILTRDRADGE